MQTKPTVNNKNYLTLAVHFYFYTHLVRLGVKSPRRLLRKMSIFQLWTSENRPWRSQRQWLRNSNMAAETGSTYVFESMTDIINILTANRTLLTTASSKWVSLGDSNNDRQPEMTAETGNTYIAETVRDSIEIRTAYQVLSITMNSMKL